MAFRRTGAVTPLRALCVLLFLYSGFFASAVQQAWVAKYNNGTNTISQAVDIALDQNGNIYVAGSSTRSTPPYDSDYVVIKYSPLGNQLWVNRFGSPGINDTVRAMVATIDGDVFVTGTTNTVKYLSSGLLAWTAPYAGRDIAVDAGGNSYVTGFLTNDFATVKIDANGSNLWVRTWDYIGKQDISHAIAVNTSGEVFVGGLAVWICFPQCYIEPHIVKYDSQGNQQWEIAFGRAEHWWDTEFKGFECDEEGNLYTALTRTGRACCTWGIAKVAGSGEVLWGKSFSSSHGEGVRALSLDADANVYSTGGLVDASFQTVKLTTAGTNLWTAKYWGPTPPLHRGYAVASDTSGNAYATGQSTGIGTGNDYATIKYGTNGAQLWVKRFTEAGNSDDQAHAIAVSPSGDIYVTGFSNPTNGLYEITTIKYVQMPPIEKQSDGSIVLSFFGTPSSNYLIQASSSLTTWTNLGTVTANSTGLYTFEDTNAPALPQRFYRTVAE